MTDEATQPGVRISEDVWRQFRQDVQDRHGTVRGHLSSEVESALREYINASRGGDTHDRLRRMEDQLDEIAAAVADDSTNDSDGGTDSVSKTTERRIDEIMSDVRDRAEELGTPRVREDDIEAAIERNAGTSYKTIQRYKKLLQNQREIFPHPNNDEVYFARPEAFVTFVEQNPQIDDGKRDDIADYFGWEWWESAAPEGVSVDENKRGFQ